MNVNAKEIVSEARGWLKTPFHHHAREQYIGIDCIGLIMMIAKKLKLVSKNNQCFYLYDKKDYCYKRDSHIMTNLVEQHLIKCNNLEPGQIIILGKEQYKHIGIIADYGCYSQYSMIHACIQRTVVIEHRLSRDILSQIHGLYKFINMR